MKIKELKKITANLKNRIMANWKEMLIEVFKKTGDDFEKMETTLTDQELVKEFDNDFGCVEGLPFTAWGGNYVYFPVVYVGHESVGYAPRNVCDIKTFHQGGQ